MIAVAMMAAALSGASAAKIAPMSPADLAANCKAAAHVLQEGLSVPTDGWRDYERMWTAWNERHVRAEPDAERRRAQDAWAAARFGRRNLTGAAYVQQRAAAQAVVADCRRAMGGGR